MNHQEALKLLEEATAHVQSNREGHLSLMEAIGVLKAAVAENAALRAKVQRHSETDSKPEGGNVP